MNLNINSNKIELADFSLPFILAVEHIPYVYVAFENNLSD